MSGAAITGRPATLITVPPMIDSEFCRFLLTHYRIAHVEEPHTFGFSFIYTLLNGRTLVSPLTFNDRYQVTAPKGVVDQFDPLVPPDFRLLRADAGEAAQITADMDRFNGVLGHAVAQYAYAILLPHRDIMIVPLTRGCPAWEVATVRTIYPVLASVLGLLLKLSDDNTRAALALIRTIMDEVDARLAGGGSYLIGDSLSLSDLAFVTAAGPMVQPEHDGSAAPSFAELPAEMQEVVTEFRAHPAGQFVQQIYREWRQIAVA